MCALANCCPQSIFCNPVGPDSQICVNIDTNFVVFSTTDFRIIITP